MDYLAGLNFLEVMYLTERVFVAKVINTNVFLLVNFAQNNKTELDCTNVAWYYNSTSEPSLDDEIPFVDVLELVDEDILQELIFNMNIFNKRS